jgi:hypothetical protein
VQRQVYEGFSVVLPDGWSDLFDDATFADADGDPPIRFASERGGPGMVLVTVPLLDPEEQPGNDAGELEALAQDWGKRRGLSAPISSSTEARRDGTMATAVYALRGQFVQLWFLSNGASLVHASYVCDWDAREEERATREAVVASLRFA